MPFPAAYKLIDDDHAIRDQLLTSTDRIVDLINDLCATLDDYGPSYDQISCTSTVPEAHTPLSVGWVWSGELEDIPPGWTACGAKGNDGGYRIQPDETHRELEDLREVLGNFQPSPFQILKGTGLPDAIRIEIDARSLRRDFPTGVATGRIDIRWHADSTGVYALFPFAGEVTSPISDRWQEIPMSQYWLAVESGQSVWEIGDEELEAMLAA